MMDMLLIMRQKNGPCLSFCFFHDDIVCKYSANKLNKGMLVIDSMLRSRKSFSEVKNEDLAWAWWWSSSVINHVLDIRWGFPQPSFFFSGSRKYSVGWDVFEIEVVAVKADFI